MPDVWRFIGRIFRRRNTSHRILIGVVLVFMVVSFINIPSAASPSNQDATATITATPPPTFEVGGQIANITPRTIRAAKSAHLTWLKWQVQIDDTRAFTWLKRAHAAGLKMLFSVVARKDDKNSVLRADFPKKYASYLANLAKQGADGIEVLNEMNLDREWPTGKIDPRLYENLLHIVYPAIKAANSQTLVISGGLAPTGAEGYYGLDHVWNDDHYFQGMAEAGVGQYVDCIGVHYNEGILPPDASSGDPRDDYPTRYFQANLERARKPFPGKPLCFTELGYLTPEGYPPLPSNFAWAQNTTIAQQAAWLAEAAKLSSNTGDVRLMIIFNIDFTYYGADPQAGYAMIRADGTCPACNALAQATPAH